MHTFTATTPGQARLLLGPTYQPLLAAAMHGRKSAAELAKEVNLPLKQAHHQIQRLCQAGLLVIDGERPRAGRPVKLYRAAAHLYRVPFHLTDAEDLATLLRALHEPYLKRVFLGLAHHVVAAETAGEFQVSLDEFGHLSVINVRPPDRPQLATGQASMSEITLLPASYAELEEKLEALHRWIMERSGEESAHPHARRGVYGLMFTRENPA